MADVNAIAVLGAGSWGTALAIQFARAGRPTRLWGRDADAITDMQSRRCNQKYLPDASFPEPLHAVESVTAAVNGCRDILVSVPSHAFRETLQLCTPLSTNNTRIAWATKGFEVDTGKLPHQVADDELGENHALAVLSGPTFATEVGEGLPTALTIGSSDEAFARDLANSISDGNFRAYTSDDMVGIEVGGAVKNVLAIGAGLSDGLGYGANTRIALINRGLVEMTRLGVAIGARAETFTGLAGMGDLVLTCTDNQSRNRRMGLALASGKTVDEAAREIRQVVEGVLAAKAVYQQAGRMQIEMPIVEQIYRILYEGVPPAEAVRALMGRALKPE